MARKMNYVTLIDPQQIAICRANDEPVYNDCAHCNEKDAVIYGGIQDDEGRWGICRLSNGLFKNAVYCEPCFKALTAAAADQAAEDELTYSREIALG